MPTIAEYWEPAEMKDDPASQVFIHKVNTNGYYVAKRLNDVRIVFMQFRPESDYVFLGVYRMSLALSDTTRIVWERVSDECNLAHLDYYSQLRN